MDIPFYKMQGTGNDFIVINNEQLNYSNEQLSTLAKQICQRKRSVGSDALMVVDHPTQGGDIKMIFFNEDGSEAEMCGNGARCLARYAYENQLAKEEMIIETLAGAVPAWRLNERQYKVQLNQPTVEQFNLSYQEKWQVDYLELGNPGIPHLVVSCKEVLTSPLEELYEWAKELRSWSYLPKGANVNLYAIDHNGKVVIRTFERGVEDFTLACGTGAGSTAYVLYKKGILNEPHISLLALGGELEVEVTPEGLYLIGETTIVIEGKIRDENVGL